MMKGGILEEPHATAAATRTTRTRRSYLKPFTALFVAAVYARIHGQTRHSHAHTVRRVQKCAISNLHANLSFLDVSPIAPAEFIARRDNLARALHAEGVDAFALEPGYTFQYYGNISQQDWEPWEPEERPMLMVVEPVVDGATGAVAAKTSFLSPAFEEGRVRMLGIPARGELDIVTWEEHWNPYKTLRESRLFAGRENVSIMVDEEMRDYIVRGLQANGFETVGLRGEVEAVRQIKTPAEIELIRAVNTGTVEAVRAMRPCLVPGLIEDEVMEILDNSMLSIGFSLFFDIVLFEENGALPHGGFVTGGKVLKEDSVVLIDVGGHYLGYSSDICRSFFIPTWKEWSLWEKAISIMTFSKPSSALTTATTNSDLYAEKLKVWDIVLEAQTESAKMFKPNNSAASVDIAARTVISDAGYGEMFTHRVGHGIGIKGAFVIRTETLSLNKGNHEVLLRPGMTFTSEPGIYMLNKFGVRHEDIYVVREEGEAELLTGKRAVSPWEP